MPPSRSVSLSGIRSTLGIGSAAIDPVHEPRCDRISVTAPADERVAGPDVELVTRWWTAAKGERRQYTRSAVANAVIGIVK
ncbi:hypothetical protein [Novosphingobium sp. EMRT-2]|uniref:hypothetical protein n=1 Tax=Novosphingobium sp. EMRT-2 TaxID=2571749 RepID=UPI0010BD18C2|nr:hypothetical protein [Novosphingobium sp. EMRT-2]QCI94834.1 hypothetical protein FA702_15785 [Novosphingobium sp. EMRT-2]